MKKIYFLLLIFFIHTNVYSQNIVYLDVQYIIDNSRKKLVEMFSYHNVGMYWYNFFAGLNEVENE